MPPNSHVYTDASRPLAERVADLLGRMTVEEKAGQLFHAIITMQPDGSVVEDPAEAPTQASTTELLHDRLMTHFNLMSGSTPRAMAEWHNALQRRAAETRLGIPVTLSTDPRHSFSDNPGAALRSGPFSQWPETLGLAAIGDEDLVRQYADSVRREYLAVGLRVALHPQIDLVTEPRWSRAGMTFGEDADLTSRLVGPYLEGLRGGPTIGPESVAGMVKHFPGGGPQLDGEDPHFPYGKEQVYPGGCFDYHLQPFRAAIAAGATQMMPYYGQPIGTEYEEVGFGFNRGIITGLLREQLGFTGIVCTDWGLITDQSIMGEPHVARAWGVEHLSVPERVRKVLDAGADQFGGEACPEVVVDLVRSGAVPESRLDVSVARLLAEKFRLGLFDERRYVDPERAEVLVGSEDLRAAGARAQSRATTVLKNDRLVPGGGPALPIIGRPRTYVQGIDEDVAAEYVEVAASPAEADLAILRLATPYDPRPGRFESFFHAGRLDFPPERLAEILALLDSVPTVVAIHLERPAVIPEIAQHSSALVAVYGASDRALMDALSGRVPPAGRLPFQLPRSMAEVEQGRPDVPQESPNPLYPFGHGPSYGTS
jgi:beta-glucosidase